MSRPREIHESAGILVIGHDYNVQAAMLQVTRDISYVTLSEHGGVVGDMTFNIDMGRNNRKFIFLS